jgi:hypothetical protein
LAPPIESLDPRDFWGQILLDHVIKRELGALGSCPCALGPPVAASAEAAASTHLVPDWSDGGNANAPPFASMPLADYATYQYGCYRHLTRETFRGRSCTAS